MVSDLGAGPLEADACLCFFAVYFEDDHAGSAVKNRQLRRKKGSGLTRLVHSNSLLFGSFMCRFLVSGLTFRVQNFTRGRNGIAGGLYGSRETLSLSGADTSKSLTFWAQKLGV